MKGAGSNSSRISMRKVFKAAGGTYLKVAFVELV